MRIVYNDSPIIFIYSKDLVLFSTFPNVSLKSGTGFKLILATVFANQGWSNFMDATEMEIQTSFLLVQLAAKGTNQLPKEIKYKC